MADWLFVSAADQELENIFVVELDMSKTIFFVFMIAALSACGGGGDGGNSVFQCEFVGGSALAGMSAGGSANVQDAVDGNLSTFATISGAADGEFIAGGSRRVSGGGNAGLFVTLPSVVTASQIILDTRLDNQTVETATGPTLDITGVSGTPASNYVSFDTTLEYDEIRFRFTTGGEYLIYEFCHSANVG